MELLSRKEVWNITYNHALGETASWFYAQIRDNAKIYGRRSAQSGRDASELLGHRPDLAEAEEAVLMEVSSVVAGDELAAHAAQTAGAIARAPRDVLLRTKAKFIRRANVVSGKTLDL